MIALVITLFCISLILAVSAWEEYRDISMDILPRSFDDARKLAGASFFFMMVVVAMWRLM